MTRPKLYISGGLHGYDRHERDIFFQSHMAIANQKGWQSVLPQEIAAYHPNSDPCPRAYSYHDFHSAACWLRGDLIEMLQCDAVWMIGEWQRSVGAALVEHHTACAAGMTVYYTVGANEHAWYDLPTVNKVAGLEVKDG